MSKWFYIKLFHNDTILTSLLGSRIMATDKRVFTLRLQESNFEKIKYIANINKRSIAMQIEYLIEQHIEEYEEINGSIPIGDKNL